MTTEPFGVTRMKSINGTLMISGTEHFFDWLAIVFGTCVILSIQATSFTKLATWQDAIWLQNSVLHTYRPQVYSPKETFIIKQLQKYLKIFNDRFKQHIILHKMRHLMLICLAILEVSYQNVTAQ